MKNIKKDFLLILLFCHPFLHSEKGMAQYSIQSVSKNHINNSITAIKKDDSGFLWVGTVHGLFRFDAYTYKSFTGNEHESNSIISNVIRKIYKDAGGRLWIGTDLGATVYNPETNVFMKLGKGLDNCSVNTFRELTDGRVIAGTSQGIALIDPYTLNVEFLSIPFKETQPRNDNILHSATDSKGNIWLGGLNGFYRLSIQKPGTPPKVEVLPQARHLGFFAIDHFDRIWYGDGGKLRLLTVSDNLTKVKEIEIESGTNMEAKSIVIKNSNVWIGSHYKGLFRFGLDNTGKIMEKEVLWVNPAKQNDLTNSITTLSSDKSGNIWIGTIDGVFVVTPDIKNQFNAINTDNSDIAHDVVSDVITDKDSNLWASTSDGLNKITMENGTLSVKHFRLHEDMDNPITDNRMQAIIADEEGMLWIGTKHRLIHFDPETEKFVDSKHLNEFLQRYDAYFVKSIYKDDQGNIWIGLLYGGVVCYQHKTGTLHKLKLSGFDLDNSNILALTKDKAGNLWIGTRKKGLIKIFAEELVFTHHEILDIETYEKFQRGSQNNDRRLNSNWINTIVHSSDHVIYVGTYDGLYKYNPLENKFVQINLSQFGTSVYIANIIEDFSGVLWIFSSEGVYKYRPNTDKPEYFELYNGLFARIDYIMGSCLDQKGNIIVGGINGITWFNPEIIKVDTVSTKVFISNFSINNKEVLPDGKHIQSDINSCESILLYHNDSHIAFEFSTLNFTSPQKIRYCYNLEGFDSEWYFLPRDRNFIAYSNLLPGNYTLHIRATNSNGMWSEQIRSIEITVFPPWWATWWSYCLYVSIVGGIIVVVFMVLQSRYRYRQNEQINQWKQRFYVNVTHGFKTPLTLIQVPINSLLDEDRKLSGSEKQLLLSMVNKNVRRLSQLIHQLMEFRKIDQHKATLSLVEADISEFIRMICQSFAELFQSKELSFVYESPEKPVLVIFDPEKIEIILYNLLLNAYTFTPKGGKVTVRCSDDEQQDKIIVSITDTGIGIKPENHKRIFERFWQVKDSSTLIPSGAGIGLALSKDMIELHKGEISVESEVDKGSIFTFWLYKGNKHFGRKHHIQVIREEQEMLKPTLANHIAELERDTKRISLATRNENVRAERIFIISSDNDMVTLLQFVLRDYFAESFSDATIALEAIATNAPQLIIIDTIALNKKQGIEMTRRLKSNASTRDIPVIFFTTEDNNEDIALFFNIGIDSFMVKPFDNHHLQALVKQLMQSRINIREKVRMDMIISPKIESVKSESEMFMAKVMEIIEENISNEGFNLIDFANKMNVSRSVLHTKTERFTSKSPIELLRHVRMQKAQQLLKTNAYNITQVSYMVGFSDPRYFSTCFKKQFGLRPTEYMNENGDFSDNTEPESGSQS